MTKLTENEKNVVINIVENDYVSCEPTVDDPAETWSNCIDCGPMEILTGKALSGVVSSLSQKALIETFGKSDEAVTRLTADGMKAYFELGRGV